MHLTIPIFMEIALVVLVGFVDMLMLSSCGDGAVAAVGLASQIVMLVFLVYRFAASGVAVVCAQYNILNHILCHTIPHFPGKIKVSFS